MDLKAILAKANEIAKTDEPKVQNNVPKPPVKADLPLLCVCGHPSDAHTDGTDECVVMECDCISFCPPSQIVDVNPDKTPVKVQPGTADNLDDQAEGKPISNQEFKVPFTVPPQEESSETTPILDTETKIPDEECAHLCDCGAWWTHGNRMKCRFPDMVKYGKCPDCLQGKPQQEPDGDYTEDKNGDVKLTPIAEIKVRNDERIICKDMSVEQLTYHIAMNAKRIEELRVRSLEARKMRSELEEEAVRDLPEAEREKFLQELRRGKESKAPRVRKEKKETPKNREKALVEELTGKGKSLKDAKLIAGWMIKTGKTQAQVEAFLYD